jgi:MFS family permease
MSRAARRPVFGGWWIVGASFIGLAVCQSPMLFLTFGVLLKPLDHEFGWGRGPSSLALSIASVSLALMSPVVGWAIDRFGSRRVILPSLLGFGVTMASLYFLNGSLLQFYALYLLLGVMGAGANNVAYMRVISTWFGELRGRALGVASSGTLVGQAVATYLAQRLIDNFGWRVAYLGLGCTIVCIGLPIVALVIRDRPAGTSVATESGQAHSPTPAARPASLVALLHRPLSWVMIGLGFLVAVSLNGAQVHLVPLLTDRGISPDLATGGLAAVVAVVAVSARLVVGTLFDYCFAPRVAMVAFLLPALGLTVGLLSSAAWPCYILVALLSVGAGSESDVLGYLTSRYFAVESFGRIYGCVFGGFMAGTALGPYLFGAIFDRTHSYQFALTVSVALILVMCVILARLPRFAVAADIVRQNTCDVARGVI